MQHSVFYLCVLAAFSSVCIGQDWGYRWNNGPNTWSTNYPECGLNNQSPIALDIYNTDWYTESNLEALSLTAEFLGYSNPADGLVTNEENTVNVALNYSDLSNTPRFVVGFNDSTATTVYLRSIQFHWKSEHTIDGTSYPLEVQMTHTDEQNNMTWKIAYLYKYCATTREGGLETISEAAVGVKTWGTSVPITSFAPQTLMPYGRFTTLNTCNYYLYRGSLTTPPCTADVVWLVYSKPQCMKLSQLTRLSQIRDSNGFRISTNSRPLQPLGNRSVQYYPCKPY